MKKLILVALIVLGINGGTSWAVDGLKSVFYTQIAAGQVGAWAFQTRYLISNQSQETLEATLAFWSADGSVAQPSLTSKWRGMEGSLTVRDSEWSLVVPAGAILELTLEAEEVFVGKARLDKPENLSVQCLLGLAAGDLVGIKNLGFDNFLLREIEVHALSGSKSLTFPLSYFEGDQTINTAFALSNLSDSPADVELIRKHGPSKIIKIERQAIFSRYFDQLWELPPIDVFPLVVEDIVEVKANVPLGLSIFRTAASLPLSGLEASKRLMSVEPQVQAEVAQEFDLSINETAQISGTEITVTFWNLEEDSRCPREVVCVWEGQAVIVLLVQAEDNPSIEVELINREGHPQLAQEQFEDHVIELIMVEPIPLTGEEGFDIEDYKIRLRIVPAG